MIPQSMKNDRFSLCAVLILFLLPMSVIGQGISAFFGTSVVLPNDQLRTYSKPGVGASFSFEVPITRRLSAYASFGLVSFGKRYYPLNSTPFGTSAFNADAAPLQAGARYYLSNPSKFLGRFFVSTEIGATIFSLKSTLNGVTSSSTEARPSFAPGAGYRFRRLFEVSVRPQFLLSTDQSTTFNYWDFRIGLTIPHFSLAYGALAPQSRE